MDDTTSKIVVGMTAGLIRKGLIWGGAALAGHGVALGFTPVDYAAAAAGIAATAWSFWGDFGRPIVLAQLEVLKARSLAAAAKIHAAGLPPVTAAEIAAHSPTLTADRVIQVAQTMAPEIKASVIPVSPTIVTAKAAS